MATPQATAKLLAGPGGLNATGHKAVLCKAFKNAVKNWCRDRKNPPKKGNFNDYYYRSLSNIRPQGQALAQGLSREVGGVFYRNAAVAGNSAGRFAGLVTAGTALGGTAGNAAQTALNIFGTIGGFPSGMATGAAASRLQGVAAKAISRSYGAAGVAGAVRTRWADGVFKSTGQCLEIKGPTDSPRPGQLLDQQKMGNGQAPAVVSCANCPAANCSKSKPCR